MTVHKFESSRKTTVEINEYKHIKRKNMKNNPQKKILRQDGFPIGAEMAKKRYSSAGTTTPFLKQLILTILLFAILPVSALAVDAPGTLYVGQTKITGSGYWKTNSDGTLTTEGANNDNYNVYYDGTATLTLNSATIKGDNSAIEVPFGAGIYALCSSSNQPVALTIELIGTNTITGNYGIFVDAEQGQTVGTNASLLIRNSSDNGILEVSGSSHGIYVKSGTGNASLTINDASVVAKTTQTSSGYAGVCVQSSIFATSSPQLSLAVNGGSLTASGTGSSDGILFYVGDPSATNATTSLTVSNNAIVRANGSAGGITSNSSTGIQYETGSDSTGGIVFDGKNGTVYGSVTLQDDLTISEGESLTIPQGASLDCNEKLTNNGTIVNTGGTLNGEPGGSGKIENKPTIDTQPTNATVTEGETASFTVAATGGNLSYQWQQSTDSGQNWTDIEGATDATYSTGKTTTNMNGYQYRCVVSNSAGSIPSDAVTVHVHTWGNPVWSWSEDGKNCMVTFTCANDETHTESPNATVTSEIKTPATCTKKGVTTYTATVEFNGQTYTDTKVVADIPATGHDYENGYCTICGEKDPDYVAPEPEPEPEPTYYRVDLRPVEGATVILSADEVEEGGTLTFTIEIAEGYVADDLMVTVSQGIGKAVEVKPDEAGVYTVKEVDGLVTITVYGVTEEPATAIERIETLRIYAAEGILHVETPTRQRVTIVSMGGALIADGEQEGARIYRDLNAGVYIVRVGDYATKVRVE